MEKVWAARLNLRKSHLPDIAYVPCAMTLTSDSHPISIFIVMQDIPPVVICVTISTVLYGTGCPSYSVPHTRCTQSPLID